MKLILTRNFYTRDITQGVLTLEGKPELRMVTLEGAVPRDGESYVKHCLPPGDYLLECADCAVTYKGVNLHLPWLFLGNIPWFPNATIAMTDMSRRPRLGEIFLGNCRTDNGFLVANTDDYAMKQWARLSREAYESGEPVTLTIVNSPDIVFEDTYRDKAAIERKEREERERREELIQELYGSLPPM